MDWQQAAALCIVAATAGAFAWRHWRRRKLRAGCGSGCGCDGLAALPPRETVVYRARKGGPSEIIVRTK